MNFEIKDGVLEKQLDDDNQKVVIPDNVTVIGSGAFGNCSSITSVTIPETVVSIGERAFEDCDSLTDIKSSGGSKIAKLSAMLRKVFSKNKNSAVLSKNVTHIGKMAFCGCFSLNAIDIDKKNEEYKTIDGVLYDKDVKTLLICPSGKKSVTIPDTVTTIGDYAFYGCMRLSEIKFPSGLVSIGDFAFYECSGLSSIVMPEGLESIGKRAFNCCTNLKSIKIPFRVSKIGKKRSKILSG